MASRSGLIVVIVIVVLRYMLCNSQSSLISCGLCAQVECYTHSSQEFFFNHLYLHFHLMFVPIPHSLHSAWIHKLKTNFVFINYEKRQKQQWSLLKRGACCYSIWHSHPKIVCPITGILWKGLPFSHKILLAPFQIDFCYKPSGASGYWSSREMVT